jgi:hypothetical protein
MWIQARKDPDKKWLQMRYCITEGDIDMVIKDWEDEWKIPVLTQDLPERTTEEEAGQGETQPQEVPVPKKWRTGQTKTKKTDEGAAKTGTQKGKKNTTQPTQVQQKQSEAAQGTTPSPNSQEPGGNKRPTTDRRSMQEYEGTKNTSRIYDHRG